MDRKGEFERYVQSLRRIVAFLSSFAALAEMAAAMPLPARLALIWILKLAASVSHRLVCNTANDLGFQADFSDLEFTCDGSEPADLLYLAFCFSELARTLGILASYVESRSPGESIEIIALSPGLLANALIWFRAALRHLPDWAAPIPDT